MSNLGLTTLIASELPIITASLLSTSMNLLGPFEIFLLLTFEDRVHKTVSARLLVSTREVLARTRLVGHAPETPSPRYGPHCPV